MTNPAGGVPRFPAPDQKKIHGRSSPAQQFGFPSLLFPITAEVTHSLPTLHSLPLLIVTTDNDNNQTPARHRPSKPNVSSPHHHLLLPLSLTDSPPPGPTTDSTSRTSPRAAHRPSSTSGGRSTSSSPPTARSWTSSRCGRPRCAGRRTSSTGTCRAPRRRCARCRRGTLWVRSS